MPDPLLLFVISSPSGTGKTTLCRRLLKEFPEVRFSVSTTTRPQRPQEVDGRDYHFVSREEFQQLVAAGAFVEWAEVHDNLYGTTRAAVDNQRGQGGVLLFDVDVQGAANIRRAFPDAVLVFILPPSLQELERRIRGRQTESASQLAVRLANATSELRHFREFDYLVINDQLERAYRQLSSIVVAERCRRHRLEPAALALLPTSEGAGS